MADKPIPVVVLVRRGNLQPGDITGLAPDAAAKAVAAKLVQYVNAPPPEATVPAAPPVDKAIKAPPKAKTAKKTAKKKAAKKPKK